MPTQNNSETRRTFIKQSTMMAAAASLGPAVPTLSAADNPIRTPPLQFPSGFLLGVASAAYQIEGGWEDDGKGESIWDRWSHVPDKVKVPGDVTADHYHHYREDIDLLKKLGINVYRFSIAWTRVFPEGRGRINPKGLDFYKELVRLLKENDIIPAITLFHWDLPQKLQEEGGWTNPQIAHNFEQFARLMFKELGNDVGYWITFNEPWVTCFMGYAIGGHPPGIKDFSQALLASHHILLAHSRAVKAFRELQLTGKIGITLDLFMGFAEKDHPEDMRAAEMINQSHHGWYADPILKGHYPEMVWEQYKKQKIQLPEIKSGDLETIRQPIDFLGLNYYNADTWVHDPKGWWPYEATQIKPEDQKYKLPCWRPDGLLALLKRLHAAYDGIPILITENGYFGDDFVNHKKEVNDEARIEYIFRHLEACKQALDAGVNLKGYMVWSFLDDYEWGDYGRMGLVYVNYKTQERIIKKSGTWYAEGIRHGFQLP
jgi:beta-glucosidase